MQPTSNPALVPATPSLVEQVQARRDQLERGLTADTISPSTRTDIEAAIAAVAPMLTGDLANIPATVGHELARWLETSKYIGVQSAAPTDSNGAGDEAQAAGQPSASSLAPVAAATPTAKGLAAVAKADAAKN